MSSKPKLAGAQVTAFGGAAMRAGHLIADGNPKIFNDNFAQKLADWDTNKILSFVKNTDPRVASCWVLRNRFAEDRLWEARKRNVQQYVILGAGLDSFALRNADFLDDLIVYEVDDPSLQQWKRQRIEGLHLLTVSK